MSEATPDRTISGLGPPRARSGVHPDASRLLARNRTTPPQPAGPGGQATDASRVAAVVAGGAGTQTIKQQLNVSIPRDLRARVRAAYRATATAEGHRSFSDFIASVVEGEACRLEVKYNDGRPFVGGEIELVSGRPMGD
jgi:hypothetical protein